MRLFLTLTTGFCRLRATLTIRVSRSEEASLVEPILEGQTCCSRWSSHRQMRAFVRKVRAVPYKLTVSTIVFAAKIDSVWNWLSRCQCQVSNLKMPKFLSRMKSQRNFNWWKKSSYWFQMAAHVHTSFCHTKQTRQSKKITISSIILWMAQRVSWT